jgi:hypothetical protein
MDGLAFITALTAASAEKGDERSLGLIDGIDLVMDRLAADGVPSSEWMTEVRDYIARAKEHHV